MPWVKTDDRFDDDSDLDYMTVGAVALDKCAQTWSSRNGTDGFIPEARVRKLFGYSPEDLDVLLTKCDPKNKPWWIKAEGGYQIRSFLKYNPPAAATAELRAARAEAGRRGAASKWGSKPDGNTDGNSHGNSHGYCHGKPDGTCQDADGNGQSKTDAPYPVSRIPIPGEEIEDIYAGGNDGTLWPTWDEVKAASAGVGLPDDEVRKFFDHYNSQRWVKGNGLPVGSVLSLLGIWKTNWETKRAQEMREEKERSARQTRPDSDDRRHPVEGKDWKLVEVNGKVIRCAPGTKTPFDEPGWYRSRCFPVPDNATSVMGASR